MLALALGWVFGANVNIDRRVPGRELSHLSSDLGVREIYTVLGLGISQRDGASQFRVTERSSVFSEVSLYQVDVARDLTRPKPASLLDLSRPEWQITPDLRGTTPHGSRDSCASQVDITRDLGVAEIEPP